MGAYYIKYIEQRQRITNPLTLLIEQGQEIEKDGKVNVEAISHTDGYDIKISGNAVYVKTFHIALDDI